MLCSSRNDFCRNSFSISKSICNSHRIRSRYLIYDPSHSDAGTLIFLHVRAVSKSMLGLNLRTRCPSQDLVFLLRARGRPPNVQPFQRVKLREPQTQDLGGFASEIFDAPGFPNVETTIVSPNIALLPVSSCRLLPIVIAPLPLLPLRHCCPRYLP